jgi:FG-GAP-like repeat/Abnormal spindle-like microcephaly-assoc'd, ASPM-SPD-2-Hydin
MKRPDHVKYVCQSVACVLALVAACLAQLETRDSFTTASTPVAVAVGDFNRDGIIDIATVSVAQGPGVQVFIGKGDGTFGIPTAYDIGRATGPIAVADVNLDGKLDLIVVDSACAHSICENSVSVLLGNGDGTFQAPMIFSTPPGPSGLAVGDFNGDGIPDIATIDQADYSTECDCVGVLLGNGDGTFQQPIISYPAKGLPSAMAAGNFSNSKNLDLAVAIGEESSSEVQILRGNGDGTFSLGNVYQLPAPEPLSMAAADLRNNGRTDLLIGEFGGMGVAVLLSKGNGAFQQAVVYQAGTPLGVAVADMNGDGIPDIIAATLGKNAESGLVDVLLGNGNGTFKTAVSYASGKFPEAIAVADFNGDRLPDVTVSDQIGDVEIVLLNTGTVHFSPTSPLNFKKQAVGTTSPTQKVTLTNSGKTALNISAMKVAGQFAMTSTCSKAITPNKSCTLSVTFSPKSQGAKSGTITINDSASSKPQVIEVSGTGT